MENTHPFNLSTIIMYILLHIFEFTSISVACLFTSSMQTVNKIVNSTLFAFRDEYVEL